MIDVNGQKLEPGDLILYTVSAGRSSIIKFGEVKGFNKNSRLEVQGVDVYYWRPANPVIEFVHHSIEYQSKTSFLDMYSSRSIKLPEELIPPAILWVLREGGKLVNTSVSEEGWKSKNDTFYVSPDASQVIQKVLWGDNRRIK